MSSVQDKRRAFRALLEGPGGHAAPGTYDVISALLVERAGFDVIHVSGSGTHRSAGFADIGLLSLTEQVARATLIADAVGLPVLADCETGHGNVVNTVRAVREFERAGVAAIHIEDQLTPKHPGARAAFVSPEEFLGKIKAALDTRADPEFAIVARMDPRDEPYEQRLELGLRAVETGADAIWIGFGDVADVRRIVQDIPRPMIGIPRRPQITPRLYGELGYKIAVLPGVLPTAAAIGMAGALQALKETDSEVPFYESMANSAEIRAWCGQIGAAAAEDLLRRYAPSAGARGGAPGH
jgi:2-methylisocitrate lyase-like PEP mutase family enzyme